MHNGGVHKRHYLANIHNGGVHKEPYVAYVHSGGVHKTTFRHCVHSGGVNILCQLISVVLFSFIEAQELIFLHRRDHNWT